MADEQGARGSRKAAHGHDRLCALIAKALGEHAGEIADALMKKCREGDLRSIKLAHEIAAAYQEEPASPEPPEPKRSLATEWANEPEWTDEDEQALQAERKTL